MAKLSHDAAGNQVLSVELADRGYSIHIGGGMLGCVGELTREVLPKVQHAVVISDQKVAPLAETVTGSLQQVGLRLTQLVVPSGEPSKSVDQIAQLWNQMLADFTDRGSVVVAVGGGVVGDLAGFAAATFARGMPLIQVPTTLLSHVDSSVGGKTGINLPGTKNIVGSFWQPKLVAIDINSLASLPQREYVSGLAEVAKYGVIMEPSIFEYLEQHATATVEKQPEQIKHLVSQSCLCKAIVVEEDERETSGRRAILNYGHTFGHAIESVAGYGSLLHGEAVAIGMNMAAAMAAAMGRVDEQFVARQEKLLQALHLPTTFPDADAEVMWEKMQHDKKTQHGKLHFVLPTRLGHVELVSGVERSMVVDAINQCS
ncbi:MAG: 3-dehydroquinate synthase [Aureliella sp.]